MRLFFIPKNVPSLALKLNYPLFLYLFCFLHNYMIQQIKHKITNKIVSLKSTVQPSIFISLIYNIVWNQLKINIICRSLKPIHSYPLCDHGVLSWSYANTCTVLNITHIIVSIITYHMKSLLHSEGFTRAILYVRFLVRMKNVNLDVNYIYKTSTHQPIYPTYNAHPTMPINQSSIVVVDLLGDGGLIPQARK